MQRYVHKLLSKVERATLRAKLKVQRSRVDGDLFVDYGWIKLLFSDDGDMQEIYYHQNCREYFEGDMAVLGKYISRGDVVVDVGANMGFVATMMARCVGREGEVHCFEPSKGTYLKLLKTIAANQLKQVYPYNLGCGRDHSTALLNTVSRSSGNNSIIAKGKKGGAEEIKIVPLDSVEALQNRSVSFLKIDVEGFESEVLLGARKMIARGRPVIYIELGGEYLQNTRRSLEILDSCGYEAKVPVDIDWSEVGNGVNFVALPRLA